MSNGNHLFRKWADWLNRIDEDQLQDLFINHYGFEQFRGVIKPYEGSHHRANLAAWMTQGQLVFVCTTIRRMTEKQQEVRKKAKNRKEDARRIISLRKLLDDLALNARVLTRQRFRQLYSGDIAARFADRDFDRVAGKGANGMDKTAIESDIEALETRVQLVKRLTDKIIAHTEQNRAIVGIPPTYGQLNRLIVWLKKLFEKYYFLIMGKAYAPPPLENYSLNEDLRLLWPPLESGASRTT